VCTDYGQVAGREADQAVIGSGDGAEIGDGSHSFSISGRHREAIEWLACLKKILEVERSSVMGPDRVFDAMGRDGCPSLAYPIEE